MNRPEPTTDPTPYIRLALALSLGAAVSLGITRFAYGLLLPPMRDDLGWSYTLAGAMNTFNAVGYLIGALATPWLMRRFSPTGLLIAGSLGASLFMALSGFFTAAAPLLAQRLLAGVASALVFIAGGLLAARLGARQPQRSGFLLGIYYGGTGLGIVITALGVPPVLAAAAQQPHGWAWAWWALALVCLLATALMAWPARVLANQAAPTASSAAGPARVFRVRDFAFALAGYAGFGVGYIGYMTFVIALLREQGSSSAAITTFYALLGVAVIASSRIWAGLLDRHRNGQALARLNALLGVAAIVPALTSWPPLVIASGLLFGGVFLSVVASTTALVRHNLPPAQWAAGISAFTIVFAAGQIVGPTVVGFIADGSSGAQGLREGLVFSAVALWIGAVLALRQRAL
ncbi:major Facilitator Superfamily protein [Hydrogenophaga sp. RAC07]|uniref:YbfB/YjiJ family MFS transporter n=1 Tax=Hydrogenophaga sp. RAC07 TaxID=1842537 RepID=UPI00083CC187|nr:YbfB/YjiJ family MFS transporter [Hydrogenophaga sp. RAC07]AOF84307.1 major Facilitator Superfamily protein [Hydrogenophaga sp. RAC07]